MSTENKINNIKILLIDDMPTVRKVIKKQFEKLGVTNITEAGDGTEAWNLITNANPPFQIIISDWMMPNCTGVDLLKRIRATEATKHLPFILVTAEAEKCSILEAKQSGCTDYVVKPFDVVDISKRFQEYMEKAYVTKAA